MQKIRVIHERSGHLHPKGEVQNLFDMDSLSVDEKMPLDEKKYIAHLLNRDKRTMFVEHSSWTEDIHTYVAVDDHDYEIISEAEFKDMRAMLGNKIWPKWLAGYECIVGDYLQ